MDGPRGCLLLVLISSAVCVVSVLGSFEGYKLLSVVPSTKAEVSLLNTMADDFVDLDFWQDPAPNRTVHFVAPPAIASLVSERLSHAGMVWKTVMDDISGMVAASSPRSHADSFASPRAGGDIVDHGDYHSYDKIKTYIGQLKSRYPNNVDLTYSMTFFTHEGREVTVVKLHGTKEDNKPSIIAEAGIHAREWVSPAATMYVIEKVLQNYQSGDPKAKTMLDKYDWYFIPVTNPDGYEYSRTNYRLWRKNRRYMSRNCVGVDLNRNFDIEHGNVGTSSRCDSDIYPGDHGFSEPETANVRDLFEHLKPTLVSYLSIHAYSQLLLVPWGYVPGISRPDNYVELDRVAYLMSEAIFNSGRKDYHVGTAYQLLDYAASGASEDWALSQKAGLYAYCYELRPSGTDPRGFLLPADEIVPTGQELLASLEVMAAEMQT